MSDSFGVAGQQRDRGPASEQRHPLPQVVLTMAVFSQLGDFTARRVVSLQPSITSTMERLGVLDRLVACTKWCADVCPAVRERGIDIVDDW